MPVRSSPSSRTEASRLNPPGPCHDSLTRCWEARGCVTLHDMKTSALTVRLDPDLERRLARAAKRSGRTRSEFVREALRRQLALSQFEELRQRVMPFAEAAGYLTDEDVFRDIS